MDLCYLTLNELPMLQILLPLVLEGIFGILVFVSAKYTNLFGSKFVVFRLGIQAVSIFLWLFMAYLGTSKKEEYDHRGLRSIISEQVLDQRLSIILEWLTVFLIMLMLLTEVVWSMMNLYLMGKHMIVGMIAKIKRKR